MAEIDYCTLADVEMYAGVDFSEGIGPTDAQIATMITNASRMVDAYAGRQLAGTESHTEHFDAYYGTRHITLAQRPVVSVSSIVTLDSNGNETTLLEGRQRATHDWWLDDADAGIIRFHFAKAEHLRQYIKVTYTAGKATAPIEAKMATIMLVVRQCARAALNDENCTERMKEFWRPLLTATEREYKEMLDRVKRMALVGVTTYGIYDTTRTR